MNFILVKEEEISARVNNVDKRPGKFKKRDIDNPH